MSYDFRFKNTIKISSYKLQASYYLSVIFFLFSFLSFSQVTASIDSTSIKIGEQITYRIEVEADTSDLVVLPEGQSFMPLEVIEFYKTDTIKGKDRFKYIKEYALTQFDSGAYTIPRQKIILANKTVFTDSLKVEVNNIVVDTTKQGLYDIKPIIEVKKSIGNWWKWLLGILLTLALVAFLLYWFIWREKPLTEEEQIALLPPYDRAKLALQKLDGNHYLEKSEIKEYYSDLTMIIRKYLDEKVYDHALESTTDQLIDRLTILREGNQIDLTKETIKNIESILKRADLVKFAKSKPDVELAKLDRTTIDSEIDHVKESLPEPSEEEKLLNQKYKEEQERKKKRRKTIITIVIAVFLVAATFVGFGLKYGFTYVKDTIIGHESKELLEGDWVRSEYGFPPIYISTPKVLKRIEVELPDEIKEQVSITSFGYGSLLEQLNIVVATSTFNNPEIKEVDLEPLMEGNFKTWEAKGVQNIITKNEKFVTPNAAEGLKVFGTANFPTLIEGNYQSGNYALFFFTTENIVQQIVLMWKEDDVYSDQIIERVINSIELKVLTQEEEKK